MWETRRGRRKVKVRHATLLYDFFRFIAKLLDSHEILKQISQSPPLAVILFEAKTGASQPDTFGQKHI